MSQTKAERLVYLQKIIKKFKLKNLKIPELIYFKKKEFESDRDQIFKKIKSKFKNKKIIIRSSSKNEDQQNYSNAGKYLSISNLPIKKKLVIENIIKVISKFENKNDQILIQEYINEPEMSGVIFTREINLDGPYYVINYDASGQTDIITSGKFHHSIKNEYVYKDKKKYSKKFKPFLNNISIIEKILESDRLDIEFAKKGRQWLLFQCRNLPGKKSKRNIDKKINIALKNLEKKIIKFQNNNMTLAGKTTFFSNMADWNPAEMIGEKPKSLAISLYSELITDKIWSSQRKNYGYKDVSPNVLMLNFAGSPFIDLRTDLNSFLPLELEEKSNIKIINLILNYFKKNTHLHDKIEFNLIPTCYDFNIEKLQSLKQLNNQFKKKYFKNLKILTENILSNRDFLDKEIQKLNIFEKKLVDISKLKDHPIQKIFFIIDICKKFGTLPFAGIARISFISTKIIRSLEELRIIDNKDVNNFYGNINTVTQSMYFDLQRVKNKKTKKQFLQKYGHLRPNTYSISSFNYKERFSKYFSNVNKINKIHSKSPFRLNENKLKKIKLIFKKNNLNINVENFFRTAKLSIKYREFAKFKFTKAINAIFENLIKLGHEINIPREDMEYIEIKTILSCYSNLSTTKLKTILEKEIRENKKSFNILKKIKLPDIILNPEDIYSFNQTLAKGNYITNKKIEGKIKYLNNFNNINNLENNIILIDNADPGFDFIFTKNIKGLVTKYGGSNSHMAIRCLELNIPAAIGIGNKEFDKLVNSNVVFIDCEKKNITKLS